MTTPHSDPEAFWNNLLDNLQQFVEAKQVRQGLTRGTRIRIISGSRKGQTGTVEGLSG